MARFNTKKVTSKVKAPKGPIVVNTVSTTRTALGAPAFTRDTKSELFLLGAANFVGQDTFHEGARARDHRFGQLVHAVALHDPQWLLDFVTWLRRDGNMRTASLVAGLEGAAALHGAGNTDGWARKLVSAPLLRADEVGEALGYWAANYSTVKPGKPIHLPKPVKRGLADGATRLYNERSALKYDTASHGVRFGDVLELTHPAAKAPWQEALFKFAIDSRHGRGVATDALTMVQVQAAIRAQAALGNYDSLLDPERLSAAGMTWEDALSLAGSKVPKAKLWEAMIPSMGIFALVRNLRNFDQAGISKAAADMVADKLSDVDVIRKSKMFPFRFLAAYRAVAGNLRWAYPLEQALNHSVANVPSLPGRTLILVDRSGSMFTTNKNSDITMADQAAIFGTALALRAAKADLVEFGNGSRLLTFKPGDSLLPLVNRYGNLGGTDTPGALAKWYAKHDRVILITDEQYGQYGWNSGAGGAWIDRIVPNSVPVHTINLAGYKAAHAPGTPNRFWMGGLSDSSFGLIRLVEQGQDGTWPWQQEV